MRTERGRNEDGTRTERGRNEDEMMTKRDRTRMNCPNKSGRGRDEKTEPKSRPRQDEDKQFRVVPRTPGSDRPRNWTLKQLNHKLILIPTSVTFVTTYNTV